MSDSDRLTKLLAMHEADATDADIPYMIAQECAKANNLAQAAEWFDKCLALDPHYH